VLCCEILLLVLVVLLELGVVEQEDLLAAEVPRQVLEFFW
jgi:hypothetical protein